MAKANIDMAMQMLDPNECAERYELPNVIARDTFQLDRHRIETFDQMIEICIRYYTHHFNHVIVANGAPPEHMTRGLVLNLLIHHYRGGLEVAFNAATHGVNGGLPSVLDAIRDYFLKEQEEAWFNNVITEVVDMMDIEDIRTLMRQYIDRYGRYIDGDNAPNPDFLVPKYKQVIKAHASILHMYRDQIGQQ
jgi:hypothetical protein